MVEQTANDYANYLQQIDFSKEVRKIKKKIALSIHIKCNSMILLCFQIDPISMNIDEILTRMDEFESTILIVS